MKKIRYYLLITLVFFTSVAVSQDVDWNAAPPPDYPPIINGSSVKDFGKAFSTQVLKDCKNGELCFEVELPTIENTWFGIGFAPESNKTNILFGMAFYMTSPGVGYVRPFGTVTPGPNFINTQCQIVADGDVFSLKKVNGSIRFYHNSSNYPFSPALCELDLAAGPASSGSDDLVASYIGYSQANGVTWSKLNILDDCGDPDLWIRVGPNEIRPQNINDKVGVGVDPSAQLDVEGDVRLRSLTPDNTLLDFLVQDVNGKLFNRQVHPIALSTTFVNANNQQVKNVVDPTDPQDAVTKSYLDNALADIPDEDWLTVPGNSVSKDINDAIYTNNRIGINSNINTGSAMLFVGMNGLGWNTILDADQGPGNCRDNLLLRMSGNCGWNTAIGVEAGGNRIATVFANGQALVNGMWYWSDKGFKSKIKSINKPIEVIKKLNGKTYEMKITPESEPIPSYGFIAQEVKQILPNLARKFDNGKYAVNYDGFIPILTEAIKEQQNQIESKDKQIVALQNALQDLTKTVDQIKNDINTICDKGCAGLNTVGANPTETNELPVYLRTAWLGQNFPNPHSGMTSIKYFIPKGAKSAELKVVDLQGRLISTHILDVNGSLIELEDKNLANGMYLYTMMIDNVKIDSKRMAIEK